MCFQMRTTCVILVEKSEIIPFLAGQRLELQAGCRPGSGVSPYLLVAGAGEGVLHRVGRVPALLRAESSLVRRVA